MNACAVHMIELGEIGVAQRQRTITRQAVRAVVVAGDRLLLLASRESGDLKFPGGGLEAGEDAAGALARELDEECGRDLVAMGPLVLVTVERRAALEDPGTTFVMESGYHPCAVSQPLRTPRMDSYERQLGLSASWVGLADAIAANEAALADRPAPWVARELAVLRWLAGPGRLAALAHRRH